VDIERRSRRGPPAAGAASWVARRWSAGAGVLETHRTAILAAGTTYVVLLTLSPILMTPYRGDDTINRNYPQILTATGEPLLGAAYTEFKAQVLAWMTNQGRFFPGSTAWGLSVFATFQTRLAYKLFLVALCLLMVLLVAWLVTTLTRSRVAGVVTAIGLGATLTLSVWADGLDSFAGLLPLTICCAVASTLLLLRGRRRLSIVLAVTLWIVALLTYEVVIVMTPVLCLVIWLARRGPGRSLALLWPTLVDGVAVLYLRAHATAEAPAYQINLEPARVAVTYVKQTAAALPLSQWWYPGSGVPSPSHLVVAMAIVGVGIPVAIVLACVHRSRPDPSWRSLGMLALLGGTFWLAPPVLIAITLRWQNELPPGQGYLSVVWGYVGVAVLLATGWLALAKRHAAHPGLGSRSALVSATAVLSVLVALNVAQSLSIANQLAYPVA